MKKHLRLIMLGALLTNLGACAQNTANKQEKIKRIEPLKPRKMKVEIWSDVMCPFCYIGKRKFEDALGKFKNHENVEIVWKSFQLNPNMKTDPGKNINQYLSEVKGWSLDYAKSMNAQVTGMAADVGLQYNFDKAIVANSFDAHRLIQLAKKHGKGDAAEERLFKAYFTEGKNTADHGTLIALGKEIGLDEKEVTVMLQGKEFASEVLNDLQEADQLGIGGVPFFVFDRKYAVSGAQQSDVFLDTLNKAWENYAKNNPLILNGGDAKSCTPDRECK